MLNAAVHFSGRTRSQERPHRQGNQEISQEISMREGRKGAREAGGRESDRRGHSHERQGRKTANLLKAPTDHSHAVQELRGREGSGLARGTGSPNVPCGCVARAVSGFVFNNWH